MLVFLNEIDLSGIIKLLKMRHILIVAKTEHRQIKRWGVCDKYHVR
jgi:hypothetical protein